MKLPENVEPKKFLAACEVAGIKITSRFKGVTFLKQDQRHPVWIAQLTLKGKRVWSKQFPFTVEGEVEASMAYEKYIMEYEQIHGPIKSPGNPRRKTKS
jgi:hypothetical protein